MTGRRGGILIPLFSLRSARGWGIGEIGDLEPMTRWLSSAGQRLLQLLPINEMPPGKTSPYSALSAMAIDPQFISMADLEDFAGLGGEAALDADTRRELDAARLSLSIDYRTVRRLKLAALHRAFIAFRDREWQQGSHRAAALRGFISEQSWWLEDYALYRALHARFDERPWLDWPEPLRARHPAAIEAARAEMADEMLFRQYLQWIAGDQWSHARAGAGDVALFGDLPFMVSGDSADVWARQDQFRLDASVGVPPDAFSETGQDWGLPVYHWDVQASRDFDWLRDRARRNADLYDGYRVDHLVGFYRTYYRTRDGEAQFTPGDEGSQRALGERVLEVFREPGAEIIAEDLGVIPDFVRESLTRLRVPGYKVFRWERQWFDEGQPFMDPEAYPADSLATSGTHDTESMVVWWEGAPREERQAVLNVPSIRRLLTDEDVAQAMDAPTLSQNVQDALLESLYASGANTLILPIQDVCGWPDRINQPATVNDRNWTWRLPWAVDRLSTEPDAIAVASRLREWSTKYGR